MHEKNGNPPPQPKHAEERPAWADYDETSRSNKIAEQSEDRLVEAFKRGKQEKRNG